MQRVVITGLGVISSIGNSCREVVTSLREGRSGMRFLPEMEARGYRCCVAAPVRDFDQLTLPDGATDTLSEAAQYALVASQEALQQAGLTPVGFEPRRMGVIIGTGGGGEGRLPDGPPHAETPGFLEIQRMMNSTAAAAVAAYFGARGRVQSISAACSTGLYNIGRAYELIRDGQLDCCLTGGSEEETWRRVGVTADNMKGMPIGFNETPSKACRPFDKDRQGFIISAGAGVMLLESRTQALRRGARMLAEIVGYSAANDGADMFLASGDAMQRVLTDSLKQGASQGVDRLDYLNAHAAGTALGDPIEAQVIARLLGSGPRVSSTKGHNGHSQGAVGGQEAVFTALMLQHGFVAPTLNLEHVDESCGGIRHVFEVEDVPLASAATINNGLGGTNACLLMCKPEKSE